MADRIRIEDVRPEDLPLVHWIYEEAILYHKRMRYNVWKGYDKEVLALETRNGLLHKLLVNDEIALVFSAIYSDKLLWGDRDQDDAVYVHRLAVNPEFRGKRLFVYVFDWLLKEAKQKGRKYLRLDTWGDNPKMIAYYESFGYQSFNYHKSGDDPDLPSPHRNMFFILMEYEIPKLRGLSE